MAKSECFFGFLNICGCVLSIATFNMGFFVLCIIIITILLYKEDKLMIADQTLAKSCKPIVIILLLCLLCLILYFNNKLKRATFVHNILFIRQWLMFHCIFYTLLSTLMCYNLFINLHYKIVIIAVITIIVMEIYQIHIVRRFYNNELEHLATSNCNIDETKINMSTKKNAFAIFLADYRNEEINKGNKPSSFQQLSIKLAPIWSSMTDEEKNKYKVLAGKNKEKPLAQISDQQKNSCDFLSMQKYLTKMFEFILNDKELLEKKFILLHINCHTHNGEQYYFPAEIAALEFNLINGVSRTYHKIIGISKIYPRGFAGGMREYSDLFHQICCWHEHDDDYQDILLEFLTFLKDGNINQTDFQEGTLDLPYLFTAETEIGMDIMKAKSSLERFYSTVFPKDGAENYKSVFKIGSINQLLLEIKKKMKLNLDPQNIRPGMSVHDILESDMFGRGLGCMYHEMKDIAFKCSKARVIQWMSNICKHISTYTSLQIVPGRHIAAQLKDGSRMIIENANLPLTKQDLKLIDINTFKDDSILPNRIESSILTQTQQNSYLSDEENDL